MLNMLKRRQKNSRRKTTRRETRFSRFESLEERTLLATFSVANTLDSGAGSLRQAIIDANTAVGADVINFNIGGGGVQTIQPGSALPTITDPVVIDGSTQPGYADAPIIELDGSLAGSSKGLSITAGNSTVRGLVINRFESYGIDISIGGGNVVEGNYLGTTLDGTSAAGNLVGVAVYGKSSSNLIGTNGDGVGDEAERNVISGNGGAAIWVIGGTQNVIAGNYLGTDVTGNVELGGNIWGTVQMERTGGNLIGTNGDGVADDAERNVISGNSSLTPVSVAVNLKWSSNNVVAGNFIGVNATGNVALANSGNVYGVSVYLGSGNLIGTDGDGLADAAERNIISTNGPGVGISGSSNNVVAGNYIGTDVTGTIALARHGFISIGGPDNLIGTDGDGVADTAERNVIFGVSLQGSSATGNVVAGNYIGVDATGLVALGIASGIGLGRGASNNRIGTNGDGVADEAERNVISGSTGSGGIRFNGGNGTGNLVAGNYIGVDATGTGALGNRWYGIELIGQQNNQIGGSAALANTIAFNGENGVRIHDAAAGHSIRANSIHSNGGIGSGLGIDLGWDGVTLNDPGDGDAGPNGLQNFPVLSLAETGTTTRIVGTLNSTPSQAFTLDFYANTIADPSGYGEGERYLGWATVSTDLTGNVSFDVPLAAATTGGEFITATATDAAGNTSEFSAVLELPTNLPPSITSAAAVNATENQSSVIDVQSSDPDGETENGGGLTYSLTGGADQALFSIDSNTGVLTFIAAPDFETPGDAGGDNVYDVQVTVTDAGGLTDTQDIGVSVINQASITGQVFVDVDQDGLFDANEPGIDGVEIELLDSTGALLDSVFTSDGGLYLFEDLDPATYQLREIQPTGVDDGAEIVGSLGGSIVANDTMQLTLDRTDASDYVFAELGQQVTSGDTATIGFWQNKHGQSLIDAGGAGLATWLSSNFANVFGNAFDSTSVADFYKQQLFKQKSTKSAGPAKVDAQFMAVALATYFTSGNLADTVATGYGFNVSDTGIGANVVNVGTSGDAFSVADGADLTIMQLLLATNALTDTPLLLSGAANVYDTDGNGVIDAAEAALRAKANVLYSAINEGGDN